MNHTGDQKHQTKGQKINTPRQTCWSKNRDSETASSKNRDSETQTTTEKTRLRDSWKSSKILRDPNFLKDHSPLLILSLGSRQTMPVLRLDMARISPRRLGAGSSQRRGRFIAAGGGWAKQSDSRPLEKTDRAMAWGVDSYAKHVV